jgi:ferredoxin
MTFKITDDCFNCGVCEVECPQSAIYPGGVDWKRMQSNYPLFFEYMALQDKFYSEHHYYVVPDKCNGCEGIYSEPRCVLICPIGCCEPEGAHYETEGNLYSGKEYLEILADF